MIPAAICISVAAFRVLGHNPMVRCDVPGSAVAAMACVLQSGIVEYRAPSPYPSSRLRQLSPGHEL